MREIKFRAWDKTSKQMYCSRPWHFNAEYQMLSWSLNIEEKDELYPDDDQKEMIVMQYTGLKDKNGKEIYEGDILGQPDTPNPNRYEVKFLDGAWTTCRNILGTKHTDFEKLNDMESCNHQLIFLQVIGNIYENKELLK